MMTHCLRSREETVVRPEYEVMTGDESSNHVVVNVATPLRACYYIF